MGGLEMTCLGGCGRVTGMGPDYCEECVAAGKQGNHAKTDRIVLAVMGGLFAGLLAMVCGPGVR